MIRVFVLVIVAFLLAGCSGAPSESDARRYIEERIQSQSNGLISLVGFKKTNAIDREVLGQKLHVVEFELEIEFKQDLTWKGPGPFGWEGRFDAQPGHPSGMAIMMMISQGFVQANRGERKQIAGQLVYEKTEKGWRAARLGSS